MNSGRRIVCVGNRYAREDQAGPLVYDALCARPLPAGVEVVDGGLGGLLLLEVVDGCERVVFVDAVCGFAEPGTAVLLDVDRATVAVSGHLDHGAGLAWLLHMLPSVCTAGVPQVQVVGVEGPPTAALVARAAALALDAITDRNDPLATGPVQLASPGPHASDLP